MLQISKFHWTAAVTAAWLSFAGCGNPGQDVNTIVNLFSSADVARSTFQDAVKNGVRGERPVDTLLPDWQNKLRAAVSRLAELADTWENADKEVKAKYDAKVNIELKGYLDSLFGMGMMTRVLVPSWNVGTTTYSYSQYATDMATKINSDLKLVIVYYRRLFPGETTPAGDFSISTQVDNCLVDTRDACIAFYSDITLSAVDNNSPGPGLCRQYGLDNCRHQMDMARLEADYGRKSVCGKVVNGSTCARSHQEQRPDPNSADGGTQTITVCDQYEQIIVPIDWLNGSVETHLSDTAVIDYSKPGCR